MSAKAGVPIQGRLVGAGFGELRDQVARLARFELVDGSEDDGEVLTTVAIPGGAVHVLRSEAFDPDEADARVEAKGAKKPPRRHRAPPAARQ